MKRDKRNPLVLLGASFWCLLIAVSWECDLVPLPYSCCLLPGPGPYGYPLSSPIPTFFCSTQQRMCLTNVCSINKPIWGEWNLVKQSEKKIVMKVSLIHSKFCLFIHRWLGLKCTESTLVSHASYITILNERWDL